MAFNPTPSQRKAVETFGKSILLSAAAGSGKTATLTRRITESLINPEIRADISRMLIVTFTKAAASELRERIAKALNEALAADPSNEHLNRQTVILPSASICTIDSYFLELVRSNFQHLTYEDGSPLPSDFRLADDTELSVMRLSILNSVIDRHYSSASDNGKFARFIENFTGTHDEGSLIENLIDYIQFLDNLPSPAEYTARWANSYKESAELDYFKTPTGSLMRAYLEEKLDYFVTVLEEYTDMLSGEPVREKNYLPAFSYDLEFVKQLKKSLSVSYTASREFLSTYSPLSLRSLGKAADSDTDAAKMIRTKIKDELAKSIPSKFFGPDAHELSYLAGLTAESLETLNSIVLDFRSEYTAEKSLRHICEFSDLRRMAHALLISTDGTPSKIALELRKRYDAVYIDEYQDVDKVQDEIFSAISPVGGRFMVGDIKQSIYSFRGADPSVFGSLRASMPDFGTQEADECGECSIFMSENFRCDSGVIDFVNLVSNKTLVPVGGTVGYRAEDDLICKKNGAGDLPVTVGIFKKDTSLDTRLEAQFTVAQIKRLLKHEKKNDGSRIRPSDIAILCRKASHASEISKALSAAGVSVSDTTKQNFFENPEILLLISFFSAIDNPQKDICLSALMLSDIFGFSMEDLVKIRKDADKLESLYDSTVRCSEADSSNELTQKCKSFVLTLDGLRIKARSMTVEKLVRSVYRDFSIMSLCDDGKRPHEYIAANLRHFHGFARSYSSSRHGSLAGFITYINGIIDSNAKTDAPTGASSDSVSVMTIHKSKGLEFPVVFLYGCGKDFSYKNLKKSLIFSYDHGPAFNLADTTGFARIASPFRNILKLNSEQDFREEELRILYVALTRARERLFVTGECGSDPDTLLQKARSLSQFDCRITVREKRSFLEQMLPALCVEHHSFKLFTVSDPENEIFTFENDEPDLSFEGECEKPFDDEQLKAELRSRFEFKYPHEALEHLPAKLSVSRLYPDILDDDGAATLEEDTETPIPRFMLGEESVSAAEKGTATHVFMQFCDFANAERNGVDAELFRLVKNSFIPQSTADLVNRYQLEKFFRSEFYRELKNAVRIYREQRFNMLLPATRFTKNEMLLRELEGEKILVQGVIDLLYIDKNGKCVLCDYKTDFLTREEIADEKLARKKLFSRHGQQLTYYAQAVKELIGKLPDRICIYSLPLGKALDFSI